MTRHARWLALSALPALAFAGCGSDDPVFGTGPVGGGTTSSTGGSAGSGAQTTGGGGSGAQTTGGGGAGGGCEAPYEDCDGDSSNGCETDTDSVLAHCGGCDSPCSDEHATPSCVSGVCVLSCEAPWDDCDGDPANGCEIDTDTDTSHCGGCDQSCGGECSFGDCSESCDDALAIDEDDPVVALQAIGLCEGVQSAEWVLSDDSALPDNPTQLANYHLGHGILPDFGPNVNPQEGSRVLALSSGTARRPGDPGFASPNAFIKNYTSNHPPGFPKQASACPGVVTETPNDAVGLEFTVTAPAGADGFSLNVKQYSYDWPEYICSVFTDQLLMLLTPQPPNLPDANVLFDAQGDVIGPYSPFIDVCDCQGGPPCQAGGVSFPCSLGADELVDTGFEQRGATGWLLTEVPIAPGGTITVRLTAYDSGDGVLDSTALIDNWRWIAAPGSDPVTSVVANPR